MSNLKISLIFIVLFILLSGISNVFASGINMNLAQENNAGNTTLSAGMNTSAVVKTTVDSIEENSSTFGFSEILNILLIAVGFVIILLAIAILIRLKR